MSTLSALGARVLGDVPPEPSGGEIAVTIVVALGVAVGVAAIVWWRLKKKR